MSIFGTGIAGSIAQAATQARQVANERDKRAREQRPQAQRIREAFEAHLRSLEEGDQSIITAPVEEPNADRQHTTEGQVDAIASRYGEDPPPETPSDEQNEDESGGAGDSQTPPRLDLEA